MNLIAKEDLSNLKRLAKELNSTELSGIIERIEERKKITLDIPITECDLDLFKDILNNDKIMVWSYSPNENQEGINVQLNLGANIDE